MGMTIVALTHVLLANASSYGSQRLYSHRCALHTQ